MISWNLVWMSCYWRLKLLCSLNPVTLVKHDRCQFLWRKQHWRYWSQQPPKQQIPYKFPDYVGISYLCYAYYMYSSSRPPWLAGPSNIWCMKFLILQFSPFSCHFLSRKSKYSSHHFILKHPQSLKVRDQVSHPYKTSKIIVLCNLNCFYVSVRKKINLFGNFSRFH
jgi:hypothetical protein